MPVAFKKKEKAALNRTALLPRIISGAEYINP